MRHLISVILLLGLSCNLSAGQPEIKKSVVTVKSRIVTASGTVIAARGNKAIIVTAAHVVGRNKEVLIGFANGQSRVGRVQLLSRAADLAFIYAEAGSPVVAIPLASRELILRKQTDVTMASNARGFRSWSAQLISTRGGRSIQTTRGETAFGDSGGPIVQGGKLLGIINSSPDGVLVHGTGFKAISQFAKRL